MFPFRTARGVFVWGTTASRLGRLLLSVRAQASVPETLPVTRNEVLVSETFSSAEGGELFLEEYAFRAVKHAELSATLLAVANAVFGEQDSFFRERLLNGTALLADESFSQLLEISTEVAEAFPVDAATKRSHGRVDTIECLPAETVLTAEVSESAELEPLRPYAVQLGARQRVGHGICRMTMFGEVTQ
ncbi:MAG: hypothetical protein IT290_02700 [Deltaproteobacteria bacterium]|nr:hypothetical protein [Deltaproteobacteria bacterium]